MRISQDEAVDPEEELRQRIAQQQYQEPGGGEQPQVDPVESAPFEAPSYYAPVEDQGQNYQTQQQYTGPTEPERAPDPGAGAPAADQYQGFQSTWDPGATAPSNAPAGAHWDPNYAMYVSDTGGGNVPSTGGGGGSVIDRIRAYQASHPASEGIAGISAALGLPRYMYGNVPSNNELVVNGQKFKVIGAEDSPNTAYWYQGGNDAAPSFGGGGGTQQFGAQPVQRTNQPFQPVQIPNFSFGGSVSQSAPAGIWGQEYLQQLRALLMQRLQEAGKPVDENASGITQALTGARDEATRMSDRERTQLAERLYAQGGLNTDAIAQQVQQSGEKNATALGSLRGKLIMQEYQAKRDELKSLMAMALQSGDAETARAVQMQLAELEATLRREGYGVQLAAITASQNANANSSLFG